MGRQWKFLTLSMSQWMVDVFSAVLIAAVLVLAITE